MEGMTQIFEKEELNEEFKLINRVCGTLAQRMSDVEKLTKNLNNAVYYSLSTFFFCY